MITVHQVCDVLAVVRGDEPTENYQRLSSSPRLYGALYRVPAHCLAVWLRFYCFGSLSVLSQCRFQLQQAAVLREKALKTH